MNTFLQEETMDIRILYILHEERGWVFECNDGRISNRYMEGREGDNGNLGEITKEVRTS